MEVDEQGQPLVKPEDAAEDEAELQANMRTLSRRDAANFIRAVKRYGLAARLPDITAEVCCCCAALPVALRFSACVAAAVAIVSSCIMPVHELALCCLLQVGPSMEEVSEGARISLWNSLISGCERACEMATAEAQKGETRTLRHTSMCKPGHMRQQHSLPTISLPAPHTRTIIHLLTTVHLASHIAHTFHCQSSLDPDQVPPWCTQPLQTARPPSSASPCWTSSA